MGKSVQVHKPHKTRFASKSTRHLHRISQTDKARVGKDQKNLKGAKAARVQHNKMMRDKKRAAIMKEKRSTGASSPRVIVLFGLSGTINTSCVKNDLLALLVPEGHKEASTTVASSQYKIRVTILEAPHGDLLSCMEMAKVADLIAFVASGSTISDGLESHNFIDTFGLRCLSVLRALGLPNTAVLLRDLPLEMKRKQDIKKMFISRLGSELPEECKYYLADTKEDLHKFIWLSKEQHTSSPHWRHHRPYLLSEKVDMVPDDTNVGKCSLLLSGYVRAHNFCVNQLVHVSGAGDFQLAKIDVLKDPVPLTERKNYESMESDELYNEQVLNSLFPDSTKLQPLLVENIPDPLAGEQTWPTEADMADADAANRLKKLKKRALPQGTSDYQAAWIVDDTDDDNLDHDDDLGDGMIIEDGQNDHMGQDAAFSDIDDESYSIKSMDAQTDADTVMMDDDNLTREQIEAEIQKIKEAHAEDEEFPDEVDTPLDVPARKRFAKYRGLKSFRTSSWDSKESLPAEYAQIFAFDNFARTQKHVLAKVAETDSGSTDEIVPVGSYAKLFVKHVPIDIASKLCALAKKQPIIASGLLQHESKMSVLHFSLKKHDSYEAPIKSKETLVFHLGFRQFIARPIFSSDNLNSDKHKMERFLHSGRFSIASVYAPISFPPLPLVALKIVGGAPAIAATGSLRIVDPDRIILKKIILTGYPQRVSKLKASVRFMFHNPEDVRWFKPVELWTKCGRRGRVMEPVGTHGAMKCVFNGVVQQHDTVCMSLYKRAYPRWPEDKYAVLDQYC